MQRPETLRPGTRMCPAAAGGGALGRAGARIQRLSKGIADGPASAQGESQHGGILSAAHRLVVTAAHADLLESDRLIEADRRRVGRSYLEERLAHTGGAAALQQVEQHSPAEPSAAVVICDAKVEHVRLAGADAHDAVADDATTHGEYAADVADPQAVAEDAFAPGKLVGGALDAKYLRDVRLRHGADAHLRCGFEQLRSDGHRRERLPSVAG